MATAGYDLRIAVVGSGTIGLSFAALHLSHPNKKVQVIIHDPRPDIEEYVRTTLPGENSVTTICKFNFHTLISVKRIFKLRCLPDGIVRIKAASPVNDALVSIAFGRYRTGARARKRGL